jgi:hypothetical protein
MNLVKKLIKLAEDLEKEGFIEEADELTDAIEQSIPQQVPQSNDPPEVVVDNPESQSLAIPKSQDNMIKPDIEKTPENEAVEDTIALAIMAEMSKRGLSLEEIAKDDRLFNFSKSSTHWLGGD